MSGSQEPLVSILMNCYNGERWLKEAIDSVYAQTYQNWEIIFVDNCSIDDSAEIARKYDHRLKHYKTDKNISLGAARNWGLQFVSGKYLAFLDVDDTWVPNKLEKQVSILEKNPSYIFCYSGNFYMNKDGKITGSRKPKSKSGFVLPMLLKHYDVNMQSALVKYDKKYCYFDEGLSYSPDYEIFMRIASEYKAYVLYDLLVYYRKLKNSLSSQKIDRWWIEKQMTLDAVLNTKPELKDKYLKEFKLAYAKVSYYKAIYEYSVGNDAQARIEMRKIRFIRVVYFLLYILSIMPFDLWRKIHRKYRGIKC